MWIFLGRSETGVIRGRVVCVEIREEVGFAWAQYLGMATPSVSRLPGLRETLVSDARATGPMLQVLH